MKAIKMRMQKFSRPLVILMATVVVIITSIVVANATQTITTPNAVKITYSLAAGASSAAITPATNTSVLVMGCCTGPAETDVGVGQVSLLSTGNASVGLQWVGLESTPNINFTQGLDDIAKGIHIVFIDGPHKVDIQVASPTTMLIHNGATATKAGNVTLIW